jgi:hypothetical protein
MLANVLQSCEGYKDVVDHCEQWPLSPEQICHLRNKCLYIRTAYTIALEKMGNDGITWVNTCCQEAVDLLGHLWPFLLAPREETRLEVYNGSVTSTREGRG